MQTLSPSLLCVIAFAPLVGALISGLWGSRFFGQRLNRAAVHSITTLLVAVSMIGSFYVLYQVLYHDAGYNGDLYTWAEIGNVKLSIGFWVDSTTAIMLAVVTFVSLMVHIYSIGYMAGDAGYQRFFSYISLFTFSMLMLVMANNTLQLFFGWEAVGLVSYLLIGFWFDRSSANFASVKAFIMNRVGDFGFILGIGILFAYTNSFDYREIFVGSNNLSGEILNGTNWPVITAACICLFIGAMGKSAQVPLHAWLPDSMEGPTPISALIHAATMVTAGIYMVARFSPLFEQSDAALAFIMVIGAIGALFMGILGLVQNDIKRVIAYSTLSQLGYMTVALGASAYSAALFHLVTHAFFKALLFLAAGSVIVAMHHNQDIRRMGGLRKFMPLTWICFLIGTLALVGTPFLSGFYSKDSIIEAVHHSNLSVAGVAYVALLIGTFVTSLYSFRLYFLVFHGKSRFDAKIPEEDIPAHMKHEEHDHHGNPRENGWSIGLPLVLLAIPSVLAGAWLIGPMIKDNWFTRKILVDDAVHPASTQLANSFTGWLEFTMHSLMGWPVILTLLGFVVALYFYLVNPELPASIARRNGFFYRLLVNKYYADYLNINVITRAVKGLADGLWKVGDKLILDGLIVNGFGQLVYHCGGLMRKLQSGYIYHYAFAMLLGVIVLISFFVLVP